MWRTFSGLNAQDILAYQRSADHDHHSVDWKKTVAWYLRAFLRFLRWERILTVDLTPVVYSPIQWKLPSVPRYISFDDIKRLLAMPDADSSTGKRDLTMLTLFCLLGLRAGEVVGLKIDDIDWQQGQLCITGIKTRRDRVVPLILEVARVLADYIQHGRPSYPSQVVFLRTIAPIGPFADGGNLWRTVNKYLTMAGIVSSLRGPHMLRHSLATHLINHGVTVKEIADILGHISIETTGIYAKVQISRLHRVALPFPGREPGGVS